MAIFFNALDKFNNLYLTPFYVTHRGSSLSNSISVFWLRRLVLNLRKDLDQGFQAKFLQEDMPVRWDDAAHVAKLVSNLGWMLVAH